MAMNYAKGINFSLSGTHMILREYLFAVYKFFLSDTSLFFSQRSLAETE